MVSTRPVITESSSPCFNLLVTVPSAPITNDIIVTFMFHSFANTQARSRYLSLFSRSFSFTQLSVRTVKSNILQVLFFFVADHYKIWSSGRDLVISLYLKITEDRFWVLHSPFVHMVKLQLLAQFPVDHLAHPVVPSLIFFLS